MRKYGRKTRKSGRFIVRNEDMGEIELFSRENLPQIRFLKNVEYSKKIIAKFVGNLNTLLHYEKNQLCYFDG